MFSVICNCICLITFGYFIALVVECFRLDYISGRKKDLFWDATIIIWLVANAVLLIM